MVRAATNQKSPFRFAKNLEVNSSREADGSPPSPL